MGEFFSNLLGEGAGDHLSQNLHHAVGHDLYKSRHLIENFFCKLRDFKRIALRADKTDTSFEAMIYAVAATINSR